MNVNLIRSRRTVSFASLAAGATYAADESDNKNVYVKAKSDTYDLPVLLGKNRRGNPVGAAIRLNDGQVVFHFLDKRVAPVSAPTVTFTA